MTADTCPVCGAETVAAARFCHSCGTSLSAPIVDVAGRPPPSDDTSADTGGPQRLLVLAGVIGLIALVGALLLTGSEDPEDTEDSESQAIDAPIFPVSLMVVRIVFLVGFIGFLHGFFHPHD